MQKISHDSETPAHGQQVISAKDVDDAEFVAIRKGFALLRGENIAF